MSARRGTGGLISTHGGGAKSFQTKASFNAGLLHTLLSVTSKIENAINSLNLAKVLFYKKKKKTSLAFQQQTVFSEAGKFSVFNSSLSSSGGFTLLTFAKDFEVSRVFNGLTRLFFLLSDAEVVIPLAS